MSITDRRSALKAAAALMAWGAKPSIALASAKSAPFSPLAGPRSRCIYVNDLGGDIDGLFATVHMLLSHTVDLRGIVAADALDNGPHGSIEDSVALARTMIELCGMSGKVPVFAGSPEPLPKTGGPLRSPGAEAIVAEAMRNDTSLPLTIAVGGGLTEVASAVMIEPKIASRIKLIWIGGDDYPSGAIGETNFNTDPIAAQYLYNETQVPIWQLPRSVYSTTTISATELQAYVAPHGRIGKWLYDKVVNFPAKFDKKFNTGETWNLGDSPLVLLAALNDWVPSSFVGGKLSYERTGSSHYDEVICPHLNADGTFTPRSEGRKIRIYKDIDNRMMFSDFFAKLAVNFPR